VEPLIGQDAPALIVVRKGAKRELDSSLPHRYSLDLSRDSLSRVNASISDALPKIRSHCSSCQLGGVSRLDQQGIAEPEHTSSTTYRPLTDRLASGRACQEAGPS
jgi:hypothetical protein